MFPDARAGAGCAGRPQARDTLERLAGDAAPARRARAAGDNLTAVISVDEIKVYKPDPRVYQLAPDRLGVATDEIGFVSSNYWDAAGAKNFGFRVSGSIGPVRAPMRWAPGRTTC